MYGIQWKSQGVPLANCMKINRNPEGVPFLDLLQKGSPIPKTKGKFMEFNRNPKGYPVQNV
jgi:hypothetical protein